MTDALDDILREIDVSFDQRHGSSAAQPVSKTVASQKQAIPRQAFEEDMSVLANENGKAVAISIKCTWHIFLGAGLAAT